MPTQETVIPFAPASTPGNADQLDRAGQTILQLLNKAAGVAEENSTTLLLCFRLEASFSRDMQPVRQLRMH
jgi:hypothetical protein